MILKKSIQELTAEAEKSLRELTSDEVDYIIVGAVGELVELLYKLLVKCGGYREEKIVNFYACYNSQLRIPKIQKVMNNPRYDNVKGLVMGLSHAETGIVTSMFPENTCSIATGGQDIYYNMKALEWCIEHHKNKLKDLEYVIFDMYDYSYFNIDTSMGKNALNYYINWDGYIWDGHNFDNNKNFDCDFAHVQQMLYSYRYEHVTEAEVEMFQRLFPDVLKFTNYEEYEDDFKVKCITKVATEEEVDSYEIETSVLTKEFHDTYIENVCAFEKIMRMLRTINPEMVIKLVLMPRCASVEERLKKHDSILRPRYYDILDKMQEKYKFELFDLKDLREISEHREYYYDGEHLNRKGAEKFTEYFITNCM